MLSFLSRSPITRGSLPTRLRGFSSGLNKPNNKAKLLFSSRIMRNFDSNTANEKMFLRDNRGRIVISSARSLAMSLRLGLLNMCCLEGNRYSWKAVISPKLYHARPEDRQE